MGASRSEWKLVGEIRAGRREAFERLLDSYQDRVYAICRGMVGVQEAEDAAQDALVEIYKSIGSFRGDASLSTWIYRIAANVCLQRRRKHNPQTDPFDSLQLAADPDCDPGAEAARNETRREVESALARLTPNHRDAVILHELQGLTYSQCAFALGCPVGTVKSRLSHAFRQLRELLREYASESGVA